MSLTPTPPDVDPPKKPNHTWKLVGGWLLFLACYGLYMAHLGRSPASLIENSVDWLKRDPFGQPVYVLLFVTRPLHMIPASILSVVAGYCYGTVHGLLLALFASLISAQVMYELGARLGGSSSPPDSNSRLFTYQEKLRNHAFTTTVLMRWISLPYDPCSYLAGALRVSRPTFQVATLIGNIPGTLTCALFGAGIHGHFSGQLPHLDWRIPVGAILVLLAGSLIYRKLRK